MRAVRLYDREDLRTEIIDMAKEPEADEVRIKVAFAGICGSDIHNYKTGQWISRRPSTAGHEISGWVDEIGSSVSGLTKGDTVAVDSRYYCGRCAACMDKHHHLCEDLGFVGEAIDGGFAEYVTVPAHLALKCEPRMPLDVAALAEPLAVALHALNRVDNGKAETLYIIGCGPIGALIALASSILSDRKLLVNDLDHSRVSLVCQATGAIDLPLNDYIEGRGGERPGHIIDTTGNVAVIGSLLKRVRGVTLGLVGIGSGSIDVDPVQLVEREVSLVGCHAFADELPKAIALLQTYPDRFRPLIEHRISLENTPSEYDRICKGDAVGIKTLIEIGKLTSCQKVLPN